jgi:uncharacterized protein
VANAERRLLYIDASALVKLVVEEHESDALALHVGDGAALATSRLSLVEVPRATAIANPAAEVRADTDRLLASCVLVDVTDALLRTATGLTSTAVRTLDAIHLATALRIEPDELVAYDRRLLEAASQQGLTTAHPGMAPV